MSAAYRMQRVGEMDVFYGQAGPADAPGRDATSVAARGWRLGERGG